MDQHGAPRSASTRWISALLALVVLLDGTDARSEPGKWLLDVDGEILKKQSYFVFPKTLFNNSVIKMTEKCESHVDLNVSWYLRSSTCYNQVFNLQFSLTKMDLPTRLKEPTQPELKVENALDTVARSWEDGPYLFIIHIRQTDPALDLPAWSLKLEISMNGPHDYISASEWPLMLFWIGGVVFLGMLEKAVYYAEFQIQGAVVFAEVLSAVKRTLARVLVLIASLGYGIVKPRLGALLHRVVGVGLLYLLFSIVEGILRVHAERGDKDGRKTMCELVLAFIDSCVVWWISFIDRTEHSPHSGHTMKLLRLRRNVVKLSLYRHFTNTLIFAVIASIIFIIWSTRTFRMSKCLPDWGELWIDEAFWRFLFSMILLVIMFLWRPSANNQRSGVKIKVAGLMRHVDSEHLTLCVCPLRLPSACVPGWMVIGDWWMVIGWSVLRYAFSPLVDEESEEEEQEAMLNESFEGMKMRGSKTESNGTKPNKVDEDLRWVEENIPSSMADVALPPLLDSDEETMTTKFEMSKME
ncbi:hypothetical protein NHX12_009221 [Muraenolepis orangiensis]|uniref:Transmembrane protein 87A n=1 Tax=Muraenolepis orangiensis TaxID=630683 RepID=A0A9Q0DQD5_9TELE|nr:hypothetical protein NHX12_009221 [Muraenolepis orangiensis]